MALSLLLLLTLPALLLGKGLAVQHLSLGKGLDVQPTAELTVYYEALCGDSVKYLLSFEFPS